MTGCPVRWSQEDILVLFDLIHPTSSIRSMAGTAFLDSTSNGVLLEKRDGFEITQ